MEETIGERLKILREKKRYTQLRLAKNLKISNKLISMWESGKTIPSVKMLILLADYFDCSLDYLVRGKKNIVILDPAPQEIIGKPPYTEIIDPYLKVSAKLAVMNEGISVSLLQRRLGIGFTRASNIMELLEEKKIIAPVSGKVMRDVIIDKNDFEKIFNENFND